MLIKKGAEANLYLEDRHDRKVILKRRLPKEYRIPELDEQIRSERTIHEPQSMHRAKESGVPTPTVFMVDIQEATIVMEFVEGRQVKEVLNGLPMKEKLDLCHSIGTLIGRLHGHEIIHGDLTTSNMILTPNGKIVFVDFGLSEQSDELEAKGVDLHLMRRAFQSTHYRYAKECFEAVMKGYAEVVGPHKAKKAIAQIREIARRGRYVSER